METLRYVLLANGLLVVVSVAFYGLLRRETFVQANRLMLWLGVLSVLILPALQFPDWRPQRVRFAMQHTAQVIAPKVLPQAPLPPPVTITFPNGQAYPVTTIRRLARFGWSWQLALIGLYLAGLVVLTGRFALQLLSVRRLIRRSARESFDAFTLVTNPTVGAPFSFFNWVVLNPAHHMGDELEQILRHERVHVRQRHSLDMLMAEAVCILFWFNPAAYLFRKLVHQTLEFCADQAVLAEGVDARAYQYNLLKVSLSARPLPITNSFSTSQLRDRICMMNRHRSGPLAMVRYALWLSAVGLIILACRHTTNTQSDGDFIRRSNSLPATSPTRALVADLEDTGFWYRHMALFATKRGTETTYSEPILVSQKEGKLLLSPDHQWDTAIYIDGKKTTPDALAQLTPEQVDEFFLMHQFENLRGADHSALPYQLMIQTRAKPASLNNKRQTFFALLQAANLSNHPLGDSHSFGMNQLLEATFFHNKDALVERTKTNYLNVYDEFVPTTDIFINNIRSTAADVATVHVREVARLHTVERPFTSWFRHTDPAPRFVLHIQTEPKRAKRDSSFYVFSPFYTGDF